MLLENFNLIKWEFLIVMMAMHKQKKIQLAHNHYWKRLKITQVIKIKQSLLKNYYQKLNKKFQLKKIRRKNSKNNYKLWRKKNNSK